MQERLTLKNFWQILYKRWFIWIILIGVTAMLGYVYSVKTYVPTYTATAKVLITHKTAVLTPTEVKTKSSSIKRMYVSYKANNQEMISTYKELMYTPKMMSKLQTVLLKNKNYSYSKAQLEQKLSLSSQDNSLIIHFDAVAKSDGLAQTISNQAARIFKKNINSFIDTGTVKIISKAEDNHIIKSESTVKKNTTFGLLTGIYLSLLFALLWLAVGKGLRGVIK